MNNSLRKISFLSYLYLVTLSLYGQVTYKGLPLIRATTNKARYRIGSYLTNDSWRISPQIAADSMLIICRSGNESFAFYTDRDSITFTLKPGQIHPFYVLLRDSAYALTVIKGVKPDRNALTFDTSSRNDSLHFWYEPDTDNPYLQQLRQQYPIENLIGGATTDTDRALRILHWVHQQWKHNGNNEPRKSDAISILQEAKEGKLFRCVEYGIVATACLNAVGLKARVLALKTKDVETTESGAGHVLLEVYLTDLSKWALLDGQWDAMPALAGVPLNAVEFQQAVTEQYDKLEIKSLSGLPKSYYVNWIYPYLYYFDVKFDNREGTSTGTQKINGKSSLMLVPLAVKNPTRFQKRFAINNCLYTHSLNDFYARP